MNFRINGQKINIAKEAKYLGLKLDRHLIFKQHMHTIMLKSYLRYKTTTFQNVSSEAQIKNFFNSKKNYVPFLRYSSFYIFNHPMIYRICDVTMSISTWGNNERSFIDNPHLFLATRFVYNYTHYQAISVTFFFVKR